MEAGEGMDNPEPKVRDWARVGALGSVWGAIFGFLGILAAIAIAVIIYRRTVSQHFVINGHFARSELTACECEYLIRHPSCVKSLLQGASS